MEDPAPPLMFRRWTEEEDRVLLQHVAERGTKQWAHLHASGRLRDRDNKACCNRYRILKGKMARGQRPAPRATPPTALVPQIKHEWAPEQEGGAHTSLMPPAIEDQKNATEDSLIPPLWQLAPDPAAPPPPRPDQHLTWPGAPDSQLLGAWQGGDLEGLQDSAEGALAPWELFSDAVAPFLAPMDSLPDQPLSDLTDPRPALEAPATAGFAAPDGVLSASRGCFPHEGVLSASAVTVPARNGRLGTPCPSSAETASSREFHPFNNNNNFTTTPLVRRCQAVPGPEKEACQLPLESSDAGSFVSWDLRQDGCHGAAAGTGTGAGAGASAAPELLPCQNRVHVMRLQKACASLQSLTATRQPAADARGLFSFAGDHHPGLAAGEPSSLYVPIQHTPQQGPYGYMSDAAACHLAPSGLPGQGSSCLSSLTRSSSSASLGPIRQLSSHASDVRSRLDACGAPAFPPGCAVQLAMPAWLGMSMPPGMPVGPQAPSLQAASDSGSSWDQALPCAGQGMMMHHHAHTTGARLWGGSEAQAHGRALAQSGGKPSSAHSFQRHALAMPAWEGPLRSARLATEDAHLRSLSPSVCSGLGPSPEAPWPHSGMPPARCAGASGSGTLDEQLDALGHLDQSLTRKRKLVSLTNGGSRDQQWNGDCKPLVAWNRHMLLWNRGGSSA